MSKTIVGVAACVVGVMLLFPLLPSLLGRNADEAAATPQAIAPVPQPAPVPAPAAPRPEPQPRPGVPSVVSMSPANGATHVSLQTTQLVVTFSEPMGGGFSWTGGGANFPETAGQPYWLADRKTCVLPVRLQPNWSYRLGLNSKSFKNFQSASGKPLQPVVWQFTTGSQ